MLKMDSHELVQPTFITPLSLREFYYDQMIAVNESIGIVVKSS